MAELQSGGIEITALHNHLIGETPRVMYIALHEELHVCEPGQGIHDAIAKTKRLTPALQLHRRTSTSIPNRSTRFWATVAKTTVESIKSACRGRALTEGGMAVPNSMGVATALNFQPTGGGKAAITGDFVLLAKEVNPVIKTLRENGIGVTALHSHMLNDSRDFSLCTSGPMMMR